MLISQAEHAEKLDLTPLDLPNEYSLIRNHIIDDSELGRVPKVA
ncbi:MAG: hypothetical protein JWM09_693 [Francisellaceae bacterium]|nr:hypothetical protein [Francisellaceae bacterium]